jgi:RimJ/RimL family protein N-acetyltransferase
MFARTKRLVLRPGWQEDASALAQAIGDEAIVRNLARVPWPYGETEAAAYLAAEKDPRLPTFLAFSRTLGAPRLVGGCGIARNESGELELGYWIARPYWGLGFATEAARGVMRIARAAGLSGIVAGHFLDNPASGNVLRKIGFRPTGRVMQRYSVGRGTDVACAEFEQGEEAPMSHDLHTDIYGDARLIAA